ncbi:MAG: hypothetical protein ACREMV_14560 [Gemmatimonadales bacterium]
MSTAGRGVRPYVMLVALGGVLVVVVGGLGGWGAAVGGVVAVGAQIVAVALLRPVMRAPQPQFMGRWLGGMGVRALSLAGVLVLAVTLPGTLPLLETWLGFLGVLLPLLFLETRFLQ